ncbi:MAG TPA: NADPH-dependent FMN reductase [Oxalicibacterium sp.]|nr:NADPH-dependent FMN reductase [Oxalicibacterium sp.]
MSTPHEVAVIIGSLRKESINRKLAHELIKLAPPALKLSIVEIDEIPLFNQDWEMQPPQAVIDLKQAIAKAQAVLFVTPEYNRSIPGVLKNAIDAASRPYGQSAWPGKPAAIISASPSPIGGFGASHHLRQVLVSIGISAMPQPEAYLSHADKLFNDGGAIENQGTREFLQKFLDAFAHWIERQAS